MKISYKVLKKYIPDIESPEKVMQDLIMHVAEVEWVIYEANAFHNIVYGIIHEVKNHENADNLKVCIVDVWETNNIQIVCWGSNLQKWQGVAVAKIWASVLWHGQGDPVIMKKTSIRDVESYGMICASEEIGLADQYPSMHKDEILDLSHLSSQPGTCISEVLQKDDVIFEIDNKAINHRPDMFSHIGAAREIAAISQKDFNFNYTEIETSWLPDSNIKNFIPEVVKRYIICYVSCIHNTSSPQHILDILSSQAIASKGVLVDISNYSLYFLGQPAHCFDADTLAWTIHIRYAQDEESFVALNDTVYTLTSEDIVIADDNGIIALWGIIGSKHTAVSDKTTRIAIESAHFDHSIIRKTGKRLGIRTDALNVFEKNISLHLQPLSIWLIVSELQKIFPDLKIESYCDICLNTPQTIYIPENITYIQNLIGVKYSHDIAYNILKRLGILREKDMFIIPHWRTDITTLADIAEEIARISGYNNIETTIPRIQLWAISQDPIYKAKKDIRNFLTSRGYFDMYTYSFVNDNLMQKCLCDTKNCIWLKNTLSEEMTHMRPSLIPNLLTCIEENIHDMDHIRLFECEKIFLQWWDAVHEYYELWILIYKKKSENLYYTLASELQDICIKLQLPKYELIKTSQFPNFSHDGRVAEIIIQDKSVWYIWEIHPQVQENFSINWRCAFITLNIDLISQLIYQIPIYNEISSYQANNFDLTFVVSKDIAWKKIQDAIYDTHIFIRKVELFDIYESEDKLPWKRALSFTLTIQSYDCTLDDVVKNQLIHDIVTSVEKLWWKLR